MSDEHNTQSRQMAEITAMTDVAKALQPLESESIELVLRWAADSFGVGSLNLKGSTKAGTQQLDNSETAESSESQDFSDLADLYSGAGPRSDPDKALAVAYWFQKVNGDVDFNSASLNKELKHMGYGITNITSALSSLMARKPQLVIQTRKSGTSQQARKRYKVTAEGIKTVERMLKGEN